MQGGFTRPIVLRMRHFTALSRLKPPILPEGITPLGKQHVVTVAEELAHPTGSCTTTKLGRGTAKTKAFDMPHALKRGEYATNRILEIMEAYG
jgi:hypothetical protein